MQLLTYRVLLSLCAPIGALFALKQVIRRPRSFSDLCERFGAGLKTPLPQDGPVLWVHGASNGEITGARALLEDALERRSDMHILVTVNSVSGRNLVASWGLARVSVRLAPLDFSYITRRFLSRLAPSAFISIENELWPHRFTQCAKRGIPVFVIGARMSEQSQKNWEKFSWLLGPIARTTLNAVTKLAAQDQASQNRFAALGLNDTQFLPQMNLKSGVRLPDAPEADVRAFADIFPRDQTLLAASTHDGEDAVILDALVAAKATHPALKLILAPRHPKRADAIEAQVDARGLSSARKSAGADPASVDVYIADTLGDMPVWYSLAGYTFVGGSLVDKGGHTPFEPVQFGSVVLHGPFVSNHAQGFAALEKANASICTEDAASLATALTSLVDAPKRAAQMAHSGTNALNALSQETAPQRALWQALDAALAQETGHSRC